MTIRILSMFCSDFASSITLMGLCKSFSIFSTAFLCTTCCSFAALNLFSLSSCLSSHGPRWQVVGLASYGVAPRQHPQIMAVPFPLLGPTTPTTLDFRQARIGTHRQPLPLDLVLTVSQGDNAPSEAGARAGAPCHPRGHLWRSLWLTGEAERGM